MLVVRILKLAFIRVMISKILTGLDGIVKILVNNYILSERKSLTVLAFMICMGMSGSGVRMIGTIHIRVRQMMGVPG